MKFFDRRSQFLFIIVIHYLMSASYCFEDDKSKQKEDQKNSEQVKIQIFMSKLYLRIYMFFIFFSVVAYSTFPSLSKRFVLAYRFASFQVFSIQLFKA